MDNKELMLRSLKGLWVGDCIGNIGQLYFAHDILQALDEGIMKFGADNINPMAQHFQYSDDTEEAIVLVNHLDKHNEIKQDFLAMEWANRYMDRDPDGELYGYGLMTRKVLKDIYDGTPWRVANQTKPRIEGPSFVDKLISQAAQGKSLTAAMAEVNADIKLKMENEPNMKIGSCGNGSSMRVAPLGAHIFTKCGIIPIDPIQHIKDQATLQSEVTHCHPEGIAGAIAITLLSYIISNIYVNKLTPVYNNIYDTLLIHTPVGHVRDGIVKAADLPLDTPLPKLIEVLGNGTHVTCQDTVPLCVFLTIRTLTQYKVEEMYEKVIIEACKCFGDVDTNCAIIGGMIGIISQPPDKWIRYCQPMEGVLGDPLPVIQRKSIQSKLGFDIDKNVISDVMKETRPWSSDGFVEDQAASLYETAKVISDATRKPQPTFEEVLANRKKELGL